MSEHPLKHTKHIFRVVLALVFAIVALLLGRGFFVPKTWAAYGWYRGANVEEQMAHPVMHGGDQSCVSCHEAKDHQSKLEQHDKGKHANVRCEVCHAPVATHAKDGKRIAPMAVQKTRDLCLLCHRQLEARPKDFPQIQPQQHVEKMGGTWSETVCFDCHDPHDPMPQ